MSTSRAYAIVLAVLFIFSAHLWAQTREFTEKREAEREQKAFNEGRIWSKRCASKNMDVIASKRDNEKWKVNCIPKRTLQVSA